MSSKRQMHDLELFESKESDTLPQLVGGSLLSRPLVLNGCLLSLASRNYIKTGGPESADRFAIFSSRFIDFDCKLPIWH
jgi:hypothetical protein